MVDFVERHRLRLQGRFDYMKFAQLGSIPQLITQYLAALQLSFRWIHHRRSNQVENGQWSYDLCLTALSLSDVSNVHRPGKLGKKKR